MFCHIYSAKEAVFYDLKLSDHSDEAVFIRGVLLRKMDFISLVVRLFVEVVLFDCCVV